MSAAHQMPNPDDYHSEAKAPKHNNTITLEQSEHGHLMNIAAAAYGFLDKGLPLSVLEDANEAYKAFCGSKQQFTAYSLKRANEAKARDKSIQNVRASLAKLKAETGKWKAPDAVKKAMMGMIVSVEGLK